MIIGLLIALFVPLMLGQIIIYFIGAEEKLNGMENLALSFLLGSGILTLLVFITIVLKITSVAWLLTSLIVIIYGLLAFNKKHQFPKLFKIKSLSIDKNILFLNLDIKRVLVIILFLLLIFKLAYVFVEACSKPEYSWDASGNWTALGRQLYSVEQFMPNQLINQLTLSSNYPRHVTFMHYWIFNCLGRADDQWSKIFFPISLLMFVLLFYSYLEKQRGKPGALFFTYLLLSCPMLLYQATIGYADLTIALYFSTAILFFYRWMEEKSEAYFKIFALFMALTTWIKLEGKPLYLLGLLLLLYYLWQQKESWQKIGSKIIYYLGSFIIIGLPWQIFTLVYHLLSREQFASHLEHFGDLQNQIYIKLFVEGSWGLIWVVFLYFLLFIYYSKAKNMLFYLLNVFLFYLVIVFIFQFTSDGYDNFEVSFNRLWLSIYPTVVLFIAKYLTLDKLKTFKETE